MTAPTVGRIVHYTLTWADVEHINKRRHDFYTYRVNSESYQDTGYVAHFGPQVNTGDVLPLVITKVWSGDSINGQVLLDGSDTLWVEAINSGPDQGQWEWPVIVR